MKFGDLFEHHLCATLDVTPLHVTEPVDAELKEGVLTITMPKINPKPKHKSTKVKIK